MASSEPGSESRPQLHGPGGATVILAYHRISRRPLLAGTWVSPGRLAAQLDRLIGAGCRLLEPKHWPGDGCAGVLVTFDDGTVDLFDHRHVLTARGVKPLVCVPAGLLGRANSWEWPLPGRRTRHLDARQVRQLARMGWEFGVHGATHRDLTRLDDEQLDGEIRQARKILEEVADRPIRCFSYPYGRCSRRVAERVRAAGFSFAFSLTAVCPGVPAPYCLPRRPVYCIDGPPDVLAKVKDPAGHTWRGSWQILREKAAHGVGRWTGRFAPRAAF